MGNQLVKKYEEVIQSVQESTGMKIVSVEEIADNEVFIRLKDSFKPYFSDFSKFGDRLTLVIDKTLIIMNLLILRELDVDFISEIACYDSLIMWLPLK